MWRGLEKKAEEEVEREIANSKGVLKHHSKEYLFTSYYLILFLLHFLDIII